VVAEVVKEFVVVAVLVAYLEIGDVAFAVVVVGTSVVVVAFVSQVVCRFGYVVGIFEVDIEEIAELAVGMVSFGSLGTAAETSVFLLVVFAKLLCHLTSAFLYQNQRK
jgi:hypothetical protein